MNLYHNPHFDLQNPRKPINGYHMYEINANGDISRNGKILKHGVASNGYLTVCLCKNGKVKNFRVHRLVAEHFVPNPDNKPMVNHKDGNRQNPSADNLEWVTCSENHKHAYDVLGKEPPRPMAGKFGDAHNRSKSFALKMPDGGVRVFGSGLEASRELGIDHTSISFARKHKKVPYTFKRGKLKGITLLDTELVMQ